MADAPSLIDDLRDAEGGLDRDAIKQIIPYGDAFLFVDSVTALTKSEVEACYDVVAGSAYLEAHFRDFPIMPGVLISEGCAQAGTILIRYNLDASQQAKDLFVARVEDARFFRPVFPGARLRYCLTLKTLGSRAARLVGEARVGDAIVAKYKIVMAIMDRGALT